MNSPALCLGGITAETRQPLGRRSRQLAGLALVSKVSNYGHPYYKNSKLWAVADTFTRNERSRIITAVKARGNKLTEVRLIDLFRRHGMTGWRRHLPLRGKPDFTFARQRVVIFVDGCFWHGCDRAAIKPSVLGEEDFR